MNLNWTIIFVFLLTVLLGGGITWYAYKLVRRMGEGGLLRRVTLYLAYSALVFGIHHVLEVFMGSTIIGKAVSEGVESIAAILFGIAAIQLYRLTEV